MEALPGETWRRLLRGWKKSCTRNTLRGMGLVYEAPTLRHFTARFEQV